MLLVCHVLILDLQHLQRHSPIIGCIYSQTIFKTGFNALLAYRKIAKITPIFRRV